MSSHGHVSVVSSMVTLLILRSWKFTWICLSDQQLKRDITTVCPGFLFWYFRIQQQNCDTTSGYHLHASTPPPKWEKWGLFLLWLRTNAIPQVTKIVSKLLISERILEIHWAKFFLEFRLSCKREKCWHSARSVKTAFQGTRVLTLHSSEFSLK